MTKRVLLAGGYGVVGAQVARLLRKHHPEAEILIGGRREMEAAKLAAELGHASAAMIDVTKPAPLRAIEGIDALGVFIHEYDDHLLDEAARRGIAYMDITRGLDAQLRGLAAAALHAPTAPMLFTSHWMAGGPAIVAKRLAHDLDSVARADMSILYYTGDKMGPDSASAGAGMSQGFTARVDGEWRKVTALLAQHMTRYSGRIASEAQDGERIEAGRIYIAPGGKHLVVEQATAGGYLIRLDDGPPENSCKPAVDPMLRSLARIFGDRLLTVILTGMGCDGLKGCEAVVHVGGRVLTQDRETSVVWGMPGAVAQAGLCREVLPLHQIGTAITRIAEGEGNEQC